MPFHVALKHDVLTKGIHYPSQCGFPCACNPLGESVLLSKRTLAQNDLYAKCMVCFSYKHQWLIVPFTGEPRLCVSCASSEWVTLKVSGWLHETIDGQVGLVAGNEQSYAHLHEQLTDSVNQTSTLAPSVCCDREQQLNRHNILTGINVNVWLAMIAQ